MDGIGNGAFGCGPGSRDETAAAAVSTGREPSPASEDCAEALARRWQRDAEVARQTGEIETYLDDALRGIERPGSGNRTQCAVGSSEPTPALLVTGAQGSGKTTTALSVLARHEAGPAAPARVWVLCPSLEKAEESRDDYQRLCAEAGTARPLPAHVVRGRGATDPEHPDKAMCARSDAAAAVAQAGLSVTRSLCEAGAERCPFFDRCGYRRQAAALEGQGGVFFLAHAYAVLPTCPAPPPDIVVVDESLLDKAARTVDVGFDRLAHGPEASCGPYAAIASRLTAALLERSGPSSSLDRLRAELDRRELSAARAALETLAAQEDAGIRPGMSDAEVTRRADIAARSDTRALARILGQLEREYDAPRSLLNSVWLEEVAVAVNRRSERQRRVRVGWIEPPRWAVGTPTLLLDGTGDAALYRRLVGALRHVAVRVPRDAEVVQVVGKAFSRQSLTGQDAWGQPRSPQKCAEAAELRRQLGAFVAGLGQPTFLATYKQVEELLLEEGGLGPAVATGHFGAVRGINAWQDCEVAVVVGRQQCGIRDLEAQTRPWLAGDDQPLRTPEAYVRARREIPLADGRREALDVQIHPDPRCQAVLEQMREAEIVQAIDRVRPIFNRRTIYLLAPVVCDIVVDRVARWPELWRGGGPFDRIWRAHGLLPLQPAALRRLAPEFWPSTDAAKSALKRRRGGHSGVAPPIETYLGTRPPCWLVRFRRRGTPGAALSPAYVDARHACPRGVGRCPRPARRFRGGLGAGRPDGTNADGGVGGRFPRERRGSPALTLASCRKPESTHGILGRALVSDFCFTKIMLSKK